MSRNRATGLCLLAFSVLCFSNFVVAPAGDCQVAQPLEKVEPGQHGEHGQQEHHHLHMTLGEEKCDAKFTYEEGRLGPSHWPELCKTGKMQAPIDIRYAERLPIDDLKFNYQPADLDVINDCNQYRSLVKFPDNYCLTVRT